MEFERNTPTTAQDIALADTPRLLLDPLHSDVHADLSNAPRLQNGDVARTFEFETESTAVAATSSAKNSSAAHHRTAALLGAGTALLFIAGVVILYVVR